jgi:hypothetical protein
VRRRVAKGEKVVVTAEGKTRAAPIRLTGDQIEDLVPTRPSLLDRVDAAGREHVAKGGNSLADAKATLRGR